MAQTPLAAVRKLTAAWMNKDVAEMARWITDDIVEIGPAFPFAIRGRRAFFQVTGRSPNWRKLANLQHRPES